MPENVLKSGSRAAMAAVILLVLMPLLVKAPLLLGWLQADPMLLFSGIAHGLQAGPVPGNPTIDPNIAFTSQALGHRATLDLLHGRMSWWNFYEGVGTPLLGGMQSAGLFPLTWLLYFRQGQLYEHIALQIMAGLATYALLRKLKLPRFAAVTAALLFEFNGTFAWLANAVVNPVPFLPLVLLGVECARERAELAQKGGMLWITLGFAASLYAGFPEVAYLNGLLILFWTLTRTWMLPAGIRLRFLMKVFMGGIAALAIAAPVLIAFFDFLPLASTGIHESDAIASAHLPPSFLLSLAMPYAFGGIFQHPLYGDFWGRVGGYAGCLLLVLAMLGLCGTTYRKLRVLLGLWVLITLALTFGIPGENIFIRLIPALKLTAFFRYFPPSWEMALCILAAFGLSDMREASDTNALRTMTFALIIFVGIAAILAHHAVPDGYMRTAHGAWLFGAISMLVLTVLSFAKMPAGRRAGFLSVLVIFEAVVFFALPTLSYPKKGEIELGGVEFLQAHLGQQRFISLGPIAPNYGSYFGIASVYHNDLPTPRLWNDFVARRLDDNTSPILFLPQVRINSAGRSAAENLSRNLDSYRAIGARYLVTSADAPLPEALGAVIHQDQDLHLPLAEVYRDDVMRIFDLGRPRSYFTAEGCTLDVDDRNRLRSDCLHPAPLTRLELFMPGWHAAIDGKPIAISQNDEIFQKMALPQGSSQIDFSFEPPFIRWGYAGFVFGWLLLLSMIVPWRNRRQRFPATGTIFLPD